VGLVSENATEANATVAERLFIERTLWPKLVRIAQKISQELLPFWPGETVATFEDIRPTDVQARLAEIRTAYPLMSINEIRERYYQLPAVAWGEQVVGAVQAQSADPDTAPADPADGMRKSQFEELGRWERFTIKRWGKVTPRPFSVRALPDEIAFEVSAGLLAAGSVDEAQMIFSSARELIGAEGSD
jgi:hypothetical protein